MLPGEFLVAYWLGLGAFTAGVPGLIPGLGTNIQEAAGAQQSIKQSRETWRPKNRQRGNKTNKYMLKTWISKLKNHSRQEISFKPSIWLEQGQKYNEVI